MINLNIEKDAKVYRILDIYSKLLHGDILNKKEMANLYNVNEKTIQRDIDDIRNYFYESIETMGRKEVAYKRDKRGYCIENRDIDVITREDILVIMKILLESRAFCKSELNHLVMAILGLVNNEQRKSIKDIIGNELLNYVPLNHNQLLLSKIWELSEFIRYCEKIEITYIKTNNSQVKRQVKPVAIIFSEYYFYLIAYFNDFKLPTIFRVDRIKDYHKVNEKFYISNSNRFEDGEFRKRIQFMYSGKLQKIKFEFWGNSLEAVLDRIPTAKVVDKYDDRYLVEAEVYGDGIIKWILSQGANIKVVAPIEIKEKLINESKNIVKIYE